MRFFTDVMTVRLKGSALKGVVGEGLQLCLLSIIWPHRSSESIYEGRKGLAAGIPAFSLW